MKVTLADRPDTVIQLTAQEVDWLRSIFHFASEKGDFSYRGQDELRLFIVNLLCAIRDAK